jgi:hypothetical protein
VNKRWLLFLLSAESYTKMSYYNQGPPVGAPPPQYGRVYTPCSSCFSLLSYHGC